MTRRTRRRQLGVLTLLLGLAALAATACQPVPPKGSTTTTTAPTTTTVPAAPTLATARCASGATITVAASIVANVQRLLDASNKAKVNLCGGGYRSSASQIAVRKANCGPTYYDIWQKPSGQCSPPTAIPGTSMHEKGLAIDFTNCSTKSTSCYTWLAANAENYGLYNLPSESWHWSTNGH